MPALTLIIPTHNERENLEPLLTRLRDVAPALGVALDVLIADSGSSDGTVEAAEALMALPIQVGQFLNQGQQLHGKTNEVH